jgi:hypothetical protein
MNNKNNIKHPDADKHGSKVVDKEAEIYEKLLLLPSLKEQGRRPSDDEGKTETLLFKAAAVRMKAFLKERVHQKQETLGRLKSHQFKFQAPQTLDDQIVSAFPPHSAAIQELRQLHHAL